MGAAAYNRGSKAIAAQIDRELPPADMRLLADLSEYSASHHGTRPFQGTVVRQGPGRGEWSLMNRERGGWGQRAIVYDSLWAVARNWRLVFVGIGRDEHSRFYRVEPGASCPR